MPVTRAAGCTIIGLTSPAIRLASPCSVRRGAVASSIAARDAGDRTAHATRRLHRAMLPAMTTVPSSNTVRTLALAFAATLLSTTSGPAQAASAPARAAPIATVTDFAAAEAAIPKARTDLHEHDYSWNWRVAPDGKVAWLVMHPSQLTAPAKEQQRDRLELLVADGAGGTPRATSLDASFCWGPGEHCGPVWGSDGKSLLVGYHTEGTEFVTDVRIDRVRAGAAPGTFLRETGAHLL